MRGLMLSNEMVAAGVSGVRFQVSVSDILIPDCQHQSRSAKITVYSPLRYCISSLSDHHILKPDTINISYEMIKEGQPLMQFDGKTG